MTHINSRPNLNGNSPSDYVEAAGILLDAAAAVDAALASLSEVLHGRNYQHIDDPFIALDMRNKDVHYTRAVLDAEAIRDLALAVHRAGRELRLPIKPHAVEAPTLGAYPAHIDPVEAEIIDGMLTRAFAAGYSVRVNDGEEWTTDYTRDRATIQAEVAATDMTRLRLGRRVDGRWVRLGDVVLVHGNGEDVLTDMSASTDEQLDVLDRLISPPR